MKNLCIFSVTLAGISLLFLIPAFSPAQTREQAREQAESQLEKMTPAEIEKRISELGLTREEASRKAAELGVSLEQFLGSAKSSAPPAMAKDTTLMHVDSANIKPILLEALRTREAKPKAPLSPLGLPYFGYDVFGAVPDAFEPMAAGPVDPEYIVGSDDALRISVWGQVEFQNELTVDKEGRIFVPTVGQVLVTGLTLREAYEKLRSQMSRSYSGLVSQPPTVWMDVTISRLRPKRIFVMGEVTQPGGYTVSSYATVFSTLYSIGGPTVNGSLRDVRVLRGNNLIARVDLYDYLAGSEKTNDIRVQNNDVIYVPVRGKTVTMRGQVRREAVFELREEENLSDLLKICGGVLATAYDGIAQIDRIRPLGERRDGVEDRFVVDVPLRSVLDGTVKSLALYDGDEIQVFPVLDEKRNFVTISGSVWRPGRYELGQVKTVRDLIAAAQGIHPRTYLGFAHINRLNHDLVTRSIISFDLQKLLDDPANDQPLHSRDEVIIYSRDIVEVKDRFVVVSGSVKKPGRYELSSNMTLRDVIPLAGGYTEDAELLEAEVARVVPRGLGGDSLSLLFHPRLPSQFSPRDPSAIRSPDESRDNGDDFLLSHRDHIVVRPNPFYVTQKNVVLAGDFKYPGVYSLMKRGERLSEILERAGGPTQTSYMGGAQFFRKGERVLLDFTEAYEERNARHDVVMLDGDSIFVPARPYTVLVNGEVNNPGLLSFVEGNDVMDYINRAGGLTDSSKYAVLVKPTGESRRVNFGFLSANPQVPEGSVIKVLKMPAPTQESQPVDVAGTIKDVFAILTSAATVAFIIWQTTK